MMKQVEKWDFFEYSLSYEDSTNPFLNVTLEAEFTRQDYQIQVNGFYDGNSTFKIRFMPTQEGRWQFVTRSNIPALDGQIGEFLCVAPSANNHGPVRVSNMVNFAYEDDTPYIPVGTTCYVWNLQGDELEEQTLETLSQSPFNKIRMCIFPKRYTFNLNEPPCYPFPGAVTKEWDPSLANTYRLDEPPQYRPLRALHQTISHAGLVGGGNIPKPGEISLAHRGVLFLDEFPEFGSRVLEVMRQPMEDRLVTISRAKSSLTFSANFQLIAE